MLPLTAAALLCNACAATPYRNLAVRAMRLPEAEQPRKMEAQLCFDLARDRAQNASSARVASGIFSVAFASSGGALIASEVHRHEHEQIGKFETVALGATIATGLVSFITSIIAHGTQKQADRAAGAGLAVLEARDVAEEQRALEHCLEGKAFERREVDAAPQQPPAATKAHETQPPAVLDATSAAPPPPAAGTTAPSSSATQILPGPPFAPGTP